MPSSDDPKPDSSRVVQYSAPESMATVGDVEIVAPDKAIEVEFLLTDEDGAIVLTDQSSFSVVVGAGQLLPQIETGLLGLRVGARKKIRLEPKHAFGQRDAAKVVEFDRDEFPADVQGGDHFEAEQEGGGVLVLRILDVQEDFVRVELNHPLDGQTIEFEFQVKSVRPATRQEMDEAAHAKQGQVYHEQGSLMPVERLLRGRTER